MIGKPRRDVGLLAPVLARHLGGRPDRSAGIGLLDLRAGGRYLLCSGGLSPVVDDRTHRNVLTLRPHQPTWRRMLRPSRGARASVSRLTVPLCRARHAGQTGSRLPLPAEDGRPQISRGMRYRETPGGTAGAAFLPDAPGRIGVPSP